MMKTITSPWILLVTIALSIFSVTGTMHAAEDVLRLLVWEGYAPEPSRKEFEDMILEKYGRGVTLQVTYVEGSEEYYGPVRKKEVDLVSLTHHHFKDERFNYILNGLLLPLDIENISHYPEVIPCLRNAGYFRKGGKVFGVPICQGLYALVYSTDRVKPAPASWRALWSRTYKGAYVLGAKEYIYNIGTVALALGYPRESIGRFDDLNNAAFKKQLRSLALNAGGFWIGQDKADDLRGMSLAAGWGDGLSVLRKQGEDWRFAEPREGSMCWVDSCAVTWALAEKPFLRKVAEEWVNFMLGPEFQVENIVREISQIPTTTTIGPMLTASEKQRLHTGDAGYFSKHCVLLPTYSQRDRNGLKLLWEEAMKGIRVKTGGNP